MCQMSLIGRLIKENLILIIIQNNFNLGWFSLTFQVFWWWSNTLPIWPADPRSAPAVSTAMYRWALTCTTPGLCRSSCRRSASLCQLLAHLDGSWWTPARLSSLPFSHQRWSRSATFYSQTLNSPSEDWECRSWRRGGDWRRRRRRRRAARASSPGAAPRRCSVSPPAARRRREGGFLEPPFGSIGRDELTARRRITWPVHDGAHGEECAVAQVGQEQGEQADGGSGEPVREGEKSTEEEHACHLSMDMNSAWFSNGSSPVSRAAAVKVAELPPRAPEPNNAWKLQFNTSITSSTASHSTRVLGSVREHESRAAAHRRPPAPKSPGRLHGRGARGARSLRWLERTVSSRPAERQRNTSPRWRQSIFATERWGKYPALSRSLSSLSLSLSLLSLSSSLSLLSLRHQTSPSGNRRDVSTSLVFIHIYGNSTSEYVHIRSKREAWVPHI